MKITIHQGDCRKVLKHLPAESVHCVITSPPYFGLRDYGTAEWIGGDPECKHIVGDLRRGKGLREFSKKYRGGGIKAAQVNPILARELCPKCSAHRADLQLGLEASVDEYIKKLVAVFRQVRRVLRSDGTCWVNIGDSYHTGQSGYGRQGSTGQRFGRRHTQPNLKAGKGFEGIKPKDLFLIPQRLVIALQRDGWYVRQDIIWHKPAPLPESVYDRCTKAHEYVFLLSKRRKYFYDQASQLEPIAESSATRISQELEKQNGSKRAHAGDFGRDRAMKPVTGPALTRNKRSVWTIASEPFKQAHFATFPPALVVPIVEAGTPPYVCGKCRKPYSRMLKRTGGTKGKGFHEHSGDLTRGHRAGGKVRQAMATYKVIAQPFTPQCRCTATPIPATILDPFGGAGTVGLVADRLGRDTIMIELNPASVEIAVNRIERDGGGFMSRVEVKGEGDGKKNAAIGKADGGREQGGGTARPLGRGEQAGDEAAGRA